MKLHFQRQKKNGSAGKRQRGFVSIEVIIVLVVVLGLLALGASKMDMLNTGSDTTEEMSNIQALYANTKGLKSSQGYGTAGADLTAQLVSIKGVPKNMSIVSGVVYNLFNGAVTITSTGPGFTISSANLPTEVCIKLATKVSRSGNFVSTTINSNSAIAGEVVPADAAAQCSSATNTVGWTSAS